MGIGGLGFLASKLDSGFAEFFQGAMAKVSCMPLCHFVVMKQHLELRQI